jgi:lysophospholipase
MTIECTLAKLSYLLGKGYNNEQIKELMKRNMRGELTNTQGSQKFSMQNSTFVGAVAQVLKTNLPEDYKSIAYALTPTLINSVTSTGNIDLLKKLRKEGADLNCCDYNHLSAIHIAVQYNYLDMVKYLCEQSKNKLTCQEWTLTEWMNLNSHHCSKQL